MAYHFEWASRDESFKDRGLTVRSTEDQEQAEFRARYVGWPGHDGGRWNYLKDDLRAFWQSIFRYKPTDAERAKELRYSRFVEQTKADHQKLLKPE